MGLNKLLGGLLGISSPKPPAPVQTPVADVPKVAEAPSQMVQEDQKKTKTQTRTALFETAGGQVGAELDPNQVKKRNTLFGN